MQWLAKKRYSTHIATNQCDGRPNRGTIPLWRHAPLMRIKQTTIGVVPPTCACTFFFSFNFYPIYYLRPSFLSPMHTDNVDHLSTKSRRHEALDGFHPLGCFFGVGIWIVLAKQEGVALRYRTFSQRSLWELPFAAKGLTNRTDHRSLVNDLGFSEQICSWSCLLYTSPSPRD